MNVQNTINASILSAERKVLKYFNYPEDNTKIPFGDKGLGDMCWTIEDTDEGKVVRASSTPQSLTDEYGHYAEYPLFAYADEPQNIYRVGDYVLLIVTNPHENRPFFLTFKNDLEVEDKPPVVIMVSEDAFDSLIMGDRSGIFISTEYDRVVGDLVTVCSSGSLKTVEATITNLYNGVGVTDGHTMISLRITS